MLDIYGKDGCVRCDRIKERFEQFKIKYKYHDFAALQKNKNAVPSRVDVLALACYHEHDVTQVPFGLDMDSHELFDYVGMNKLCTQKRRTKK